MGVLAVSALRSVLYAAALLVNAAASLVLVRRLAPGGYAAYQSLTRRLARGWGRLISLYQVWALRSAAAGDPLAGEAAASLAAATGLLAAASGLAASQLLGLGPAESLAAALAVGLYASWLTIRPVLDARRPVRAAAAVLARRLVYGSLVVLLVYLAGLGVLGALASAAASLATALALAARWLREAGLEARPSRRGLRRAASWLRRGYATAPGTLANVAEEADVAIAYPVAGGAAVAGFFAANMLVSLTVDVLNQAAAYLHSFTLSTGDISSAARVVRLYLLLSAPVMGYALLHPAAVMGLLAPRYTWASAAVAVLAPALPLMASSAAANSIAGGAVKRGRGEERGILRLSSYQAAASLLYLALVAALVPAASSAWGAAAAVEAWAAAYTTAAAAKLASALAAAPREARRAVVAELLRGAPYLAAGVVAAALAAPLVPRRLPGGFLHAALALTPSALAALAAYAALVLLDPWTRGLAAAAARRLR